MLKQRFRGRVIDSGHRLLDAAFECLRADARLDAAVADFTAMLAAIFNGDEKCGTCFVCFNYRIVRLIFPSDI